MDKKSKGQALAEFALILIVLVAVIFIIVDSSRVLWGWITVQNAARAGARYAITGRDDCTTGGSTRLECIQSTTLEALSGLPLSDDPNALWEDDNYYRIEVYGVNENNEWELDNPGLPGLGVIVRTYYRVPIITPLLRPIQTSLMMNGEVWLSNEQFNSLGGDSAGVGLPPGAPSTPVATIGQTPTATHTNTPGPTATHTETPTITNTPAPTTCPTHFEGDLVAGNNFANVTGDIGGNLIFYDRGIPGTPPAGTPPAIGVAVLEGPFDTHDCPGFVVAQPLSPPLIANHVIEVRNNTDGSFDLQAVLPGTTTPTPSPSFTPSPTIPPTNTPTLTPSPTPAAPYIVNGPTCSNGPGAQFTVSGFNWPTNTTVSLFWVLADGSQEFQVNINAPHSGSFARTLTFLTVPTGAHKVRAIAGAFTKDAPFIVPCPNITPTPTTTPPTPTPAPADLIVVGPPVLISTPPIVEYQPLEFQITISNTGSVAVSEQFFNDMFLDPPDEVYSDTIPLEFSGGYQAVSNLNGMSSRTLTISVPIGFTGGLTATRVVYGVVDSILQIDESNNFNNVSTPLYVPNVTPAPSPTPSPTPDGDGGISGVVRAFIIDWVPQYRAQVYLVSGGNIVQGPIETEANGLYSFEQVAVGTYEVYACFNLGGEVYVGVRTGIMPTDPFADIFMLPDAAGCPYG